MQRQTRLELEEMRELLEPLIFELLHTVSYQIPKIVGVFALALTSMAVAYLTTVYAVRKVVSVVRSRKHLDWSKW